MAPGFPQQSLQTGLPFEGQRCAFTQTGKLQVGWRGEHTEQLHPRTWKSMIVIGDSLPQTTPSAVYAWRDKLALCLLSTFTVTLIFSLTQNLAGENDVFAKWVHGQGPNNLGLSPHLIIADIFSITYHSNSALNTLKPHQTLIQVRQNVQIVLQLPFFFSFGFIHTLNSEGSLGIWEPTQSSAIHKMDHSHWAPLWCLSLFVSKFGVSM